MNLSSLEDRDGLGLALQDQRWKWICLDGPQASRHGRLRNQNGDPHLQRRRIQSGGHVGGVPDGRKLIVQLGPPRNPRPGGPCRPRTPPRASSPSRCREVSALHPPGPRSSSRPMGRMRRSVGCSRRAERRSNKPSSTASTREFPDRTWRASHKARAKARPQPCSRDRIKATSRCRRVQVRGLRVREPTPRADSTPQSQTRSDWPGPGACPWHPGRSGARSNAPAGAEVR